MPHDPNKGAGEVQCKECKGDGYIGEARFQCEGCDETGSVTCHTCDGDGQCKACAGEGTIDCTACGGHPGWMGN
jgi:hypothetical protein